MQIRRTTVDDAQFVSDLASRSFTETFGHLYPAEDLAAFLAYAYDVEKQRVILSHPDYAVWLLEDDGVAVGHAAAGPCGLPHPDVQAGDGELKRLYVLARHLEYLRHVCQQGIRMDAGILHVLEQAPSRDRAPGSPPARGPG